MQSKSKATIIIKASSTKVKQQLSYAKNSQIKKTYRIEGNANLSGSKMIFIPDPNPKHCCPTNHL
jgi:hypothetical protein